MASHFFSSPRLTAVEEELLGLASTLGSQQATINQLELDLQNEEGSANTGQRWACELSLHVWTPLLQICNSNAK